MQKEHQKHTKHSLDYCLMKPLKFIYQLDDMLRVSGGKWSGQNFIRCTQTTAQALNDSTLLVGQTITQANNPADEDINVATAVVETVTKFQQGSVEIVEVEINPETTYWNFCNWRNSNRHK